jgi:long-chain acyl-CoA synthetase
MNDWFFTGDEGYLDEDGYLYIVGRTSDAIILKSGKIIFPDQLESELKSRTNYISDVGVFYQDGIIKAIIIPIRELIDQYGSDDNFHEIYNYLRWQVIESFNHSVPLHKRIKKIIISDVPLQRSTSGKLKRFLLLEYEKIGEGKELSVERL